MTEATQGMLVFGITTVVVSVLLHLFWKAYVRASIVSAMASAALFQVFAYFYIGYLDPFFLIALVFTSGIAFVISLAVGLAFRSWRAR